ncbi:MAG: hypothetical protein HC858_11795, partial [Brachymonas sp.]|nr:hypothetical protein [Brachymonas sp.]
MKAMVSKKHCSGARIMHRVALLATTLAMLTSCAFKEPIYQERKPELIDSHFQARIMPAVLKVEQRVVEGRLQFVFCVSDCQAPTAKVLETQEFQSELAKVVAKPKEETVGTSPTMSVDLAPSAPGAA